MLVLKLGFNEQTSMNLSHLNVPNFPFPTASPKIAHEESLNFGRVELEQMVFEKGGLLGPAAHSPCEAPCITGLNF